MALPLVSEEDLKRKGMGKGMVHKGEGQVNWTEIQESRQGNPAPFVV